MPKNHLLINRLFIYILISLSFGFSVNSSDTKEIESSRNNKLSTIDSSQEDFYYRDDDIHYYIKLSLEDAGCVVPDIIGSYISRSGTGRYSYQLIPPGGETFLENNENYYIVITPAVVYPVPSVFPRSNVDPFNIMQNRFIFDFYYYLGEIHQDANTNESQNSRDAFEDILDHLLAENPKTQKAKIIFPILKGSNHWLTGEIIVHKERDQYAIQVYAHDPFGGGQIKEQETIDQITNNIQTKITDYYQKNWRGVIPTFGEFSFHSSPYQNPRQNDSISCGLIVAEEIVKRIRGKSLNRYKLYDYGALELRYNHVRLIEDNVNEDSVNKKPKWEDYLKRYKNNILNISIRNIRDIKSISTEKKKSGDSYQGNSSSIFPFQYPISGGFGTPSQPTSAGTALSLPSQTSDVFGISSQPTSAFKAAAFGASPGKKEDIQHISDIEKTLIPNGSKLLKEPKPPKSINYNYNKYSNQYRVSTYAIFQRVPTEKSAYYWVSQDYLLSASNLAKFGIRVRSYTLEVSLLAKDGIAGVSLLESSPDTTNPTHCVTSSISIPMSLNATFGGAGASIGATPGWSRSFTAPSTKTLKHCDPNEAKVKWVYKIHNKSPIATSNFDPTQQWIWRINNLDFGTHAQMKCSLDVKYKLKKRKSYKLFCRNYRDFFKGVGRTFKDHFEFTVDLPQNETLYEKVLL